MKRIAKPVQFLADARRRFSVSGLSATTRVLGQSHCFDFEGRRIVLSLPTESPPDLDYHERSTTRISWHENGPDNLDTTIHQVHSIVLSAEVPQELSIDVKAFFDSPKSRHATDQQKRHLDTTADECAQFLVRVWRHWQAVVRWLAGPEGVGHTDIRIGRDAYGGNITGIHRRNDGYHIWNQRLSIIVKRSNTLDITKWQLLQQALSSGQSPPIWFDFISEAHDRIEAFDHRSAIASAAVACETLVRSMFWLNIAEVQNDKVRDLIDRTAAQAIIGLWEEVAGKPQSGKWETGKIHHLFKLRNDLMHRGEAPAKPSDVEKAVRAAMVFINQADAVYCARAGIQNWPAQFRALDTEPTKHDDAPSEEC